MQPNTRRQHHVWRYYLEAWTKNKQIYCKQNDNIFLTNLTKIAVITDFYKFNDLTDTDMKHLQYFITKIKPELREIDNYIINTFLSLTNLKADTSKSKKESENEIHILQNNFEEKINSEIEKDSIKYLNSLRLSDISFYKEKQYEFNVFISAQYFRTRKFKEIYTKLFRNTKFGNSENLVNIIRQIFIINYAYNMTVNNYKIQLLKNENNISLITGDQPIINLIGDGESIPKETILYYPITPKIAIKLYCNSNVFDDNLSITKDDVKYYNNKILENSFSQIYSNNEESLKNI